MLADLKEISLNTLIHLLVTLKLKGIKWPDYFIESESDNIEIAMEEFDGEYEDVELRIYRLKFLSEFAN